MGEGTLLQEDLFVLMAILQTETMRMDVRVSFHLYSHLIRRLVIIGVACRKIMILDCLRRLAQSRCEAEIEMSRGNMSTSVLDRTLLTVFRLPCVFSLSPLASTSEISLVTPASALATRNGRTQILGVTTSHIAFPPVSALCFVYGGLSSLLFPPQIYRGFGVPAPNMGVFGAFRAK